ncbi:MAG: glucans biosynthesis glucosyltransferase MdoH [Geminicoccaceae bacterium]
MDDILACPTPRAADLAEAARLKRRRLAFGLLTGVTMTALVLAMLRVLGGDGLAEVEAALVLLFILMLPWNVIGFWNALIGLGILTLSRDPVALVTPCALDGRRPAPLRSRIAVLMPVFNEQPERVFRHLGATVDSLDATGEASAFEFFVLSDTQDGDIAAQESAWFERWRARQPRPERCHYRRRSGNEGHKTGNLWDWLETHGSRFDHMLVLDADSVMSGAAILRLARVMEAHAEVGILQSLIVGLPNRSPFARIFQFGMRHGMRSYTTGSAWWQGDCGPYWGHNAMIRIAPFMAHCRLPVLPGGPPLGGRILSHDQVEAVLMRRAGWQVRVVPEEGGSFEENPPALPEFIKRDLRWCQGNWQYLDLIGRPGLHAMGRLQLLLAILMYVSGPAWVLFSLLGFGGAIGAGLSGPGAPGEPLLGRPAAWEGWALLAVTMTIVFMPKLAGVLQAMASREVRSGYGGAVRLLGSTLTELVFSFLLAPILAVGQTIFVGGMMFGRTIRWEAQLRDQRVVPLAEACRGLWPQALLGLVLGAAVMALAPPAARVWAVLFCGPLLLAIPFAWGTARAGFGRLLVRLGICATPEEIDPEPVVRAAGHALRPGPERVPVTGAAAPAAVTAPRAPQTD